MKNNWYILCNKLINNLEKKDFDKVEKHHIVKIIEGTLEDMIIESWWVDIDQNLCIDYAFSPTLVRLDRRGNGYLRNEHFKRHNVDPHFLRQVTLPTSFFEDNQKLLRDYLADFIKIVKYTDDGYMGN